MRTKESARLTLVRDGDGQEGNGSASTTYGCERVDGITSHKTQSQALSESLNELESGIADLESRYLEVCATLNLVMARLVEQRLFGIRINTIDMID